MRNASDTSVRYCQPAGHLDTVLAPTLGTPKGRNCMRQLKKVLGVAALAAFTAGTAFAAQNVANTTQKGSLLIWPLINIEGNNETLVEISNDGSHYVKVECYYVNERKGRVDFDFRLSPKQTASWAVKSMEGDQIDPPGFPDSGPWGGPAPYAEASAYRGELVCFATNEEVTQQVAHNHLTGIATIVHRLSDPPVTNDNAGSLRYSAWSFVARNAQGLPEADGVAQGRPGVLLLTGAGAGTYDACPLYNISEFNTNGSTLGGVTTFANVLTVVGCRQDLRQDYRLWLTKLQFTVWNAREQSYTGAYICVDSVNSVRLGPDQRYLTNPRNFDYGTLKTQNARYQVRGVASTQCPSSVANGLLGIHSANTSGGFSGTTTHGAGVQAGAVWWDPQVGTPFRVQTK